MTEMAVENAKPIRLAELDTFDGGNEHLRRSAIAFLKLARGDALTPRVPGTALVLLACAIHRLGNLDAEMASFREIEGEANKLGYQSLLEAVEDLERMQVLLTRWSEVAASGMFRELAQLSLDGHPVAEDTRALLQDRSSR